MSTIEGLPNDDGTGTPGPSGDEYAALRRAGLDELAERIGAIVLERDRLVYEVRDKRTLLNEIHHRVKNNLQIIISLLMLQRETHEAPAVQAALAESENRVRAMALIHQFLYERKSFSRLDLAAYLDELVRLVDSVHRGSQRGVVCRVSGPATPIMIAFEQAVPCGLLVNELLANSFKHAFPPPRTGSIQVAVDLMPDGHVRIVVSDDGPGLPPGFDLNRSPALGLQLAAVLVEQLKGDWRVGGGQPGVRVEARFPPTDRRRVART